MVGQDERQGLNSQLSPFLGGTVGYTDGLTSHEVRDIFHQLSHFNLLIVFTNGGAYILMKQTLCKRSLKPQNLPVGKSAKASRVVMSRILLDVIACTAILWCSCKTSVSLRWKLAYPRILLYAQPNLGFCLYRTRCSALLPDFCCCLRFSERWFRWRCRRRPPRCTPAVCAKGLIIAMTRR